MGNAIDLRLQLGIRPMKCALRIAPMHCSSPALTLRHMMVHQFHGTVDLRGVLEFRAIKQKHGPLVSRRQTIPGKGVYMTAWGQCGYSGHGGLLKVFTAGSGAAQNIAANDELLDFGGAFVNAQGTDFPVQ